MDETSLANLSIRKPNKEQDTDVVVYNWDDLPKAILEHILSFVPLKDAVRTCVLSKKWRYLWTEYPILALYERNISRRERFTDFMEGVLLRGFSRLKRFHLTRDLLGDASRVNLWISAAVKRNVEEFRVHLSDIPGNFALPCGLFTCAKLTHLKLFIKVALKLPSRILLPNLKLLLLVSITFVDEGSTEQLLSSPALEELTIVNCAWDNLRTLTIRTPMLKILTILDKDLDRSWIQAHSCRVLILGNNLERMHFRSRFLNDYQVAKPCSLLEACINVPGCHRIRTGQVAYRLYEMLEAMCSVKTLKLSGKAVDILSSAANLRSNLPVFPNLKLLDFGRLHLKHQAITNLLHNSPNLETLKFREGIELYPSGTIFDPAPRCFGSHLRQIELHNVILYKEQQVRVLELLLKHAVVLEELMIWPSSNCRDCMWDTKEWLEKKLLAILCGSKSLEIAVCGPKSTGIICKLLS